MLRRCPARAFIAFLCLCIKRLSVARSGDIGVGIPRFAVVVAVSLTASGVVAPRFKTSDVPSRDSVMSPSLLGFIAPHLLKPTRRLLRHGTRNESLWRLGCFRARAFSVSDLLCRECMTTSTTSPESGSGRNIGCSEVFSLWLTWTQRKPQLASAFRTLTFSHDEKKPSLAVGFASQRFAARHAIRNGRNREPWRRLQHLQGPCKQKQCECVHD